MTASDKNPNDLGNYSEFLKNYSFKGFNYVVQAGETVASLSKDTGYNMDYILKLNHLPSNANLRAGQILFFGHIYDKEGKEVIPKVSNDSNKVTTKPNSSVTDKNENY